MIFCIQKCSCWPYKKAARSSWLVVLSCQVIAACCRKESFEPSEGAAEEDEAAADEGPEPEDHETPL